MTDTATDPETLRPNPSADDHPAAAEASLPDPTADPIASDIVSPIPVETEPSVLSEPSPATEPFPVAEPSRVSEPAARATAPVRRRSGGGMLVGLLIGAAVAAGAGYGVQRYLLPQTTFDATPLEARLTAAEAEAQALRAELAQLSERAATPPVPDQALLARIDALEARETPEPGPLPDLAPLSARLDAVEASLAALADMPSGTGVAPAALAALQADVAALKSQDAGVPGELSALAAAVEDRLTEAEARAADLTTQANAIAAAATRSAALGQIAAALDSGLPYRAALTALGDADVPVALAAHADTGLPSIATLRAAFPEAARLALEQALRANPGESWTDRVGTFLRNQTGARSLAPREGTDPDAVLSRAEAALAGSDVAAALAELAALPPEGQAALADWTARAQLRLDAETALTGLLQDAGQ